MSAPLDLPAWRELAGGPVPVHGEAPPATLAWIAANEGALLDAVLRAAVPVYHDWLVEYGDEEDGRDDGAAVPAVPAPADLLPLLSHPMIYMIPVDGGSAPYVGVELSCAWDDEHGLGAMMHGTRAIEVAGADTAFAVWLAERDAGRS